MLPVSGPCTGATWSSDVPRLAGCAGATADTSGRPAIRSLSDRTADEDADAPTTTSSGVVRLGGNCASSAVWTWWALALWGSTRASAVMNLICVKNGMPSAISSAALATATCAGRLVTNCARRYQAPLRAGRASRSAAWRSRRGESALTRGPSTASSAGSTVSASVAASSATIAPAIPIEYRNRCGKIASAATENATVTELNSTVRPAVWRVRRSASRPKPSRVASSR